MTTPLEDLQVLVHKAQALVDEVHQTAGPAVMSGEGTSFAADAKLYITLKEFEVLGKELSKAFTLVEDGLSARIADKMNAAELETGQIEVGGLRYNFTPDKKLFISCKKEDQPTLINWLRTHEKGKELIKETVHDKTLQKFVTDEILGAGELPPPFIKTHIVNTLSVRKAPSK